MVNKLFISVQLIVFLDHVLLLAELAVISTLCSDPAVATASNKAAAAAKTAAGPTGLFHHAAASSMLVKDHQVLINLYSGS